MSVAKISLKARRMAAMIVAKREEMIREFYARMFALGGMITATDTYKRTMGQASVRFALDPAAYHLTLRRAPNESGSGDQMIMAGHEAMLNQWFNRPLKRQDILIAAEWCSNGSAVNAFPHELWNHVLATRKRKQNIYLDIDIWGFPGGQTFLKGVPCLSLEGIGGLISYLEPAMCRYFQPVIQATKARMMGKTTNRDAEFGMRAAVNELANIVLLQARYVGSGGRGRLTSNDTAEFMWPDLFQSIGTIGHEFMCSNQTLDRSLAECEYEMMDLALRKVPDSKLLCDLVDAETIGLENAVRALLAHPEAVKAGVRIDSGNIAEQCVLYSEALYEAGVTPERVIVFEDEVSPESTAQVYDHFREQTRREPDKLFPGAGGWWWKGVHRDVVSAAFKRSATAGNPNIKFSNSPGKESLPGHLRVYGRGETMYVADKSEQVDGEPLFVQLVKQGRIVYNESFPDQAARSDRTWGKYTRVELSAVIRGYIDSFSSKRETERKAARSRRAAAQAERDAQRNLIEQ